MMEMWLHYELLRPSSMHDKIKRHDKLNMSMALHLQRPPHMYNVRRRSLGWASAHRNGESVIQNSVRK